MLLKRWSSGTKQGDFGEVVPKEGFEPTHPYGYYVLNVARLPFRHFGRLNTLNQIKRIANYNIFKLKISIFISNYFIYALIILIL